MGLLTKREPILLAVCAATMILQGCSHLRLGVSFRAETHFAADTLHPPLSVIWEYDAGSGFSSSCAVVSQNLLFVGTLTGELHVVDLVTGNGVGSRDFGSAIVGTPVVKGVHLFITLGSGEESLISYDLIAGKTTWSILLGDIESAPLIFDHRLVVATVKGSVVCVEQETGVTLWRFDIPAHGRTRMIHSSPVSDGDIVVFGCDDGTLYAVGLDDGILRWKAPTGSAILASPSFENGIVYVGSLDQYFYAFDAGNGSMRWKRSLGSEIYSSQALDGQNVYVGTAGGIFFALNKTTGSISWQFVANGPLSASPVLSGDILYAGCIGKVLYALEAASGKLLWHYEAEGRIKSMPILWKDLLILPVEDHTILSFISGEKR